MLNNVARTHAYVGRFKPKAVSPTKNPLELHHFSTELILHFISVWTRPSWEPRAPRTKLILLVHREIQNVHYSQAISIPCLNLTVNRAETTQKMPLVLSEQSVDYPRLLKILLMNSG